MNSFIKKTKILAIDDNPMAIKILQTALQNDYELLCHDSGENVLEMVLEFKPDLLLLDIMLPGKSGYDLCAEIKAHEEVSSTPIIFLSAKSGVLARLSGYELGAIHYIEKPFEISELKAILRVVLQGERRNNDTLKLGNIKINVLKHEVSISDELIKLTTKEFLILLNLIKKPGNIFSREKLLNLVSPDCLDQSDRAIDNYISSLRKKIIKSNLEISTIYGEGYKIQAK